MRRFSLGRVVFCAVLFTLPLVIGNCWIESVDSVALPGEIASKLVYFENHKDEYDLIFLGPSLVLRSIEPLRFDEYLRDVGHPLKSFNFGIQGMRFEEARVLTDRILDLHPARLKWLVTEITAMEPVPLRGSNWLSHRSTWWHTSKGTFGVCAAVFAGDEPLKTRVDQMYGHVLHMLLKWFHIGLGKRSVLETPDLQPVLNEGFESLESHYGGEYSEDSKRHQDFLADIDKYNADVRRLAENWGVYARYIDEKRARPWAVRAVLEDVAKLRRAGIESIYMLAPGLHLKLPVLWLQKEGHIPELFAYNNPREHPELYRENMRFDATHLNAAGASRLTELLARDFIRYLDREN